MKVKHIVTDKKPVNPDMDYVSFGELDAGDMFIDPSSAGGGNIMFKLNNDTVLDLSNIANAIFISDGSSWNFDNGDEVVIVKSVTLED